MAKNCNKLLGTPDCKLAETAKESAMLRMLRIDGSQNGAKLRTRVVRDKTKYNRNVKHRKSLADAGDFPFYVGLVCLNEFCINYFFSTLCRSLKYKNKKA